MGLSQVHVDLVPSDPSAVSESYKSNATQGSPNLLGRFGIETTQKDSQGPFRLVGPPTLY